MKSLLQGSTTRSLGSTALSPIFLIAILAGFAQAAPAGGRSSDLPEKVEFNRDIRPIFSDTCFKCHGPDAKGRKGKLRLDLREEALADHKGKFPIVPGKSAMSEAFRRLVTTDHDDLMPPAESNQTLTPRQIELVRRWIDQGAEYQAHWAFVTPSDPPMPKVSRESWVRNPIDRLILARLDREGLKPSAETDRVTLLRRLSFDLTGLPPQPSDLDAFLRDRSPRAYENAVDRLLGSSHYGERMAVWWLDLVRYADTTGYHNDVPMSVWPYRDYVIRSFNSNLPFDRFTVEQVAGDLLPEATQDQKVASTYNRILQTTEEGGAQAKEYEFIYACDRVRNTAVTWLGATLLCAQCHDHKFDPYTMKDFYGFAAFFADIQEPVVGARGRGLLLPTADESAQLKKLDDEIAAARLILDTPTPELESAQSAWEADLGRELRWVPLIPVKAQASSGTTLTADAEGVVKASGKFAEKDTYTLTATAGVSRIQAFRLEVLSDPDLPSQGPGTASNGNFVLNEFVVQSVESSGTNRDVALRSAAADFSQDGYSPSKLIDGKRDTAGWAVLPQAGKAHMAVFETSAPLDRADGKASLVVTLDHQSQFGQHLVGKFRISATAATNASQGLGLPQKIRDVLAVAASARSEEQRKELAVYYRKIAPALESTRKLFASLEERKKKKVDSIPSCLVSVSGPAREVRMHVRGNWMNDTGPAMKPAIPETLGHLPAGLSPTRLDLGRWLVSRENPVTARITANRIWRLFFATGISKTLYDSGSQGEVPTHPELLDWLASEFIRSGWDVKHLVRLMVTSSAYRQTSVASPELLERDPYNRLFARQSPFRLDAEFIRDNALSVSGLLVDKTGGPSVFPYQPAGYWGPLNFPTREWQNSKGEGLYRRGLYTHWQRTFLHPSMAAFDACSREEATAERSRSNIPQQALALLNDPSYVEAARVFAARIVKEGGSTSRRRLDYALRRALDRPPRSGEVEVLLSLQRKHLEMYRKDPDAATKLLGVGDSALPAGADIAELASWTSVARTILNLHETITRE